MDLLQKIDEINKSKFPKNIIYITVVLNICTWIVLIALDYINISSLDLSVIYLPIIITVTLVIHESIHICLFKLFSDGKANIEIIKDKDIGAIIIFQKNKDVFYSKAKTIVILLAPALILTLISLVLIKMFAFQSLLIKINMLLNLTGSSTDILTSLFLLKFRDDMLINYDYTKEDGISMNIYIKEAV